MPANPANFFPSFGETVGKMCRPSGRMCSTSRNRGSSRVIWEEAAGGVRQCADFLLRDFHLSFPRNYRHHKALEALPRFASSKRTFAPKEQRTGPRLQPGPKPRCGRSPGPCGRFFAKQNLNRRQWYPRFTPHNGGVQTAQVPTNHEVARGDFAQSQRSVLLFRAQKGLHLAEHLSYPLAFSLPQTQAA